MNNHVHPVFRKILNSFYNTCLPSNHRIFNANPDAELDEVHDLENPQDEYGVIPDEHLCHFCESRRIDEGDLYLTPDPDEKPINLDGLNCCDNPDCALEALEVHYDEIAEDKLRRDREA